MGGERERGITIDIGLWKFETKKYNITIIDAPGHRDFLKNMLTGASNADVAVLVVSAKEGEFEKGYHRTGQTREHSLLAYALGVKQMIVLVNKMDDESVNYSQDRYQAISEKIKKFLNSAGYKIKKVPIIPTSGWVGDNLVEPSEQMSWYKGPTFLDALDLIEPPKRAITKPLRIPIQNVYRIKDVGIVPVGRVETGVIKPGMNITISPIMVTTEVQSVQMHHEDLDEGHPGDDIGFCIARDNLPLKRGYVVGDSKTDPPAETAHFTSQIIVMDHPNKILPGYTPVLDCHTAHIACRFDKLEKLMDKKTGKIIEANPRYLLPGQVAIVDMIPTKPMCVETFKDYPPLGRFSVRDMKRLVAVGVVKQNFRQDINVM